MKTYNDLLNEFNSFPYNKEFINLYKEFSELELMESYVDNQLYLKEYTDIGYNEILIESATINIRNLFSIIWEKIFNFIMKILRLLRDGLNALINWMDRNFNPDIRLRMLARFQKGFVDMVDQSIEVGKDVGTEVAKKLKNDIGESTDITITESSGPQFDMHAFLKEYDIAKKKFNTLSFIKNNKLKKAIQDGFIKISYDSNLKIGINPKYDILEFFKEDLDSNNYDNIVTKWKKYCDLIKNSADKRLIMKFYINNKLNKNSNIFLCMDIDKFIGLCEYLNKNMKIRDNDIYYIYKNMYPNLKTSVKVKDVEIPLELKKQNLGSARKLVALIFYKTIISYFNQKNKIPLYQKFFMNLLLFLKQCEVIILVRKDICKDLSNEVNSITNNLASLVKQISEKLKDYDYMSLLKDKNIKSTNNQINIDFILDSKFISSKEIMETIKIYWEISNNILSIMDAGCKIDQILSDIFIKSIKNIQKYE